MKLCNIIKNDVAAIFLGGINPFIPPLSTPLPATSGEAISLVFVCLS